MTARLFVDRLMKKRRGFRAKISNDWYVFEEGTALPILGPFPKRLKALEAMEAATMKNEPNKGQSKSHEAYRTDPATGERVTKTFTQEEWRSRDKSEGWQRDDETEEADGADAGGTGGDASGGESGGTTGA